MEVPITYIRRTSFGYVESDSMRLFETYWRDLRVLKKFKAVFQIV